MYVYNTEKSPRTWPVLLIVLLFSLLFTLFFAGPNEYDWWLLYYVGLVPISVVVGVVASIIDLRINMRVVRSVSVFALSAVIFLGVTTLELSGNLIYNSTYGLLLSSLDRRDQADNKTQVAVDLSGDYHLLVPRSALSLPHLSSWSIADDATFTLTSPTNQRQTVSASDIKLVYLRPLNGFSDKEQPDYLKRTTLRLVEGNYYKEDNSFMVRHRPSRIILEYRSYSVVGDSPDLSYSPTTQTFIFTPGYGTFSGNSGRSGLPIKGPVTRP